MSSVAVTEPSTKPAARDKTPPNPQRNLFNHQNNDSDIDEFEESDNECQGEPEEEDTATCDIVHWIPEKEEGLECDEMGAVIVLPAKPFMDKCLIHPLLKPKDHSAKKDFLKSMGKQCVSRVVTATVNGKVLTVQGSGSKVTQEYPVKGVVFTFRKFDQSKIQSFLEKKVVPTMRKHLEKGWTIADKNAPSFSPESCHVVKKLSHVLHDNDDVCWVLSHICNNKWKLWGSKPGNIYQIWDEGKVPIATIRKKGINKNVLKPLDVQRYEQEYPPLAADSNKKARTA